MKAGQPSVIWAGPKEGRAYRALRAAIRRRGLHILAARAAEHLQDLVANNAGSVIVACDRGSKMWSLAAFAALRRSGRRALLFVIVERSNFGNYYNLMKEGAQCYYELSEGPERISRAVRWLVTSSTA